MAKFLDSFKANFAEMTRAVMSGDVALVECTDTETGKPCAIICTVNVFEDRSVEIVPMARMFDGNPYEQINPPD
jgi:hypothetical protein